LLARSRPSRTAASKLSDEAAVIFDTLATAMLHTLQGADPDRPRRCQNHRAVLPAVVRNSLMPHESVSRWPRPNWGVAVYRVRQAPAGMRD
jgi:hypothetical protein